jgi:hypothetical protein
MRAFSAFPGVRAATRGAAPTRWLRPRGRIRARLRLPLADYALDGAVRILTIVFALIPCALTWLAEGANILRSGESRD